MALQQGYPKGGGHGDPRGSSKAEIQDRDFKKTPSVGKGNTFILTPRVDPCQEAQLAVVGQAAGAWRVLRRKAQK